MLKKILLVSGAALVWSAVQAAEVRSGKETAAPSAAEQKSKKTIAQSAAEQKKTKDQAAQRGKNKRIEELNGKRDDLIRKIHQKRKELLKHNPKIRRMYQQLLKQTRELALELDSNREMRGLNDQLLEVESQLDREKK